MKKFYLVYLFFIIFTITPCSIKAQGLLIGHIDFTSYYSVETNEWISEFRHGEWDNPAAQTPINEVSLPARDFPNTSEGDRYTQPSVSSFDFTGVTDGNPLWIFSAADNGHSWPGFRNDQSPGTFRSYIPNDNRVVSVPQPWMILELVDMTYAGSSNNPQFSLWQIQGGIVKWMATSDGIDSSDLYYMKENAHSHANIGFSSLGLYRIAYKPSAILEATGKSVVGTTKFVTFAIGTKAAWTASYYAGDDLFIEAISGDYSDSDKDGVQLLLEYAFNLDPINADFKILEQSVGTFGLPLVSLVPSGEDSALQIEYIRRKEETNPQISYFPEFKSSMEGGEWEVQITETVTTIDDEWERVVVTDSTDTSVENQRFARVRVELQEIITY